MKTLVITLLLCTLAATPLTAGNDYSYEIASLQSKVMSLESQVMMHSMAIESLKNCINFDLIC